MSYQHIQIPHEGQAITCTAQGRLQVPNCPIIPFIEGDGIGIDVTPPMRAVVDAAVQKAYGSTRRIAWMEVYAGEKAVSVYGDASGLPQETLDALTQFKVSIKGPLTTPVGGGIRSLNVAIRQQLDLFVCQRPVQWFTGVPSPVQQPQAVNMVIFRENSEDIYAGIEWQAGSDEANKVIQFLQQEMGVRAIRFDQHCGIGIKPVSEQGTKRLVRKAIEYAIEHGRDSVTLVHKGNIMKFTEGALKEWGKTIVVKDVIADAMLQQILLRPAEYDVIATLNLNGDYLSDALAAQVGGIGIAPGANLNDDVAVFEATHGTAPKYAGQDKVNPGSLILSAEMMLRHLGWVEAADLVLNGVAKAIEAKTVTYDFERLMPGATLVKASEFGQAIIDRM